MSKAELGIKRLDDLPLEDKGYNGEIPTTKLAHPLKGSARNNVWQSKFPRARCSHITVSNYE